MGVLIEVKINGVITLVDANKLEKLENGLFTDNYLPNGKIDVIEQQKDDEIESLKKIISECDAYFDTNYWYAERWIYKGTIIPEEIVQGMEECRIKKGNAQDRLRELGVQI